MKKNIRLTESQLVHIIKKTIKKVMNEHYVGLEYPKGDSWEETIRVAKDYFLNKGVDSKTIDYWMRPEGEDNQENIFIPFVYNDAILNKINFDFEFVSEFDANSITLDPNIEKQREIKFEKSLNTGEPYFKGRPVKGKNREERLEYITQTTQDYFNSQNTHPVTVIDKSGEIIVADGAHRIWLAQKLDIPIKAYVVTPTEKSGD